MSEDAKQTREFGWAPHGGRKANEATKDAGVEADAKTNHCFELVPATPGARNYVYDAKTLCGLEVAVGPKRDQALPKCGACEAEHTKLCPPPAPKAEEHPAADVHVDVDLAEHAEEHPNAHE